MKNNHNFGAMIRKLREESGEPLRIVAAAVEIDSTMLSKLERGERFPTDEQIKKFARYFKVPKDELSARAIADRFVSHYGKHPAVGDALKLIKESIVR